MKHANGSTPPSKPPFARPTKEKYARALEQNHPAISRADCARVGARAGCDPRCVIRYLRALRMHSTTVRRVEDALVKCGFARFVRTTDASPTPLPPKNGNGSGS
jgi:hypothetical protein